MKYTAIFLLAALAAGCDSSSQPLAQNSAPSSEPIRSGQMQSTIPHTTENQQPGTPVKPTGGKWSADGTPIDTAKYDKAIADAEKVLKAKPNDAEAKKELGKAYFERGFALTEARQYASALGDYRRALKNDPTHEEAKKWEQQIIGIYEMMKKEYPKPGEEPTPLPFKKEGTK